MHVIKLLSSVPFLVGISLNTVIATDTISGVSVPTLTSAATFPSNLLLPTSTTAGAVVASPTKTSSNDDDDGENDRDDDDEEDEDEYGTGNDNDGDQDNAAG